MVRLYRLLCLQKSCWVYCGRVVANWRERYVLQVSFSLGSDTFFILEGKMACCFIGHRKIENKARVFKKAKEIIERLIVEKKVKTFYFGSKSEFDDICHAAVTELQSVYPDIVRINYRCKSEYVVKKEERKGLELGLSEILKKQVILKDFEGEKISDRVLSAGKASYIERNEEMIEDSEYCIFFYHENYTPTQGERKGLSKKSGTRLAYAYAQRKQKIIINIAKEEEKNGYCGIG